MPKTFMDWFAVVSWILVQLVILIAGWFRFSSKLTAVSAKIDKLENRDEIVRKMEIDVATMKGTQNAINSRLNSVDSKLDGIHKVLGSIQQTLSEQNASTRERLAALEAQSE